MSKKVLGLDIGIGSVGWSIISRDDRPRDDSDRNKSEILQVGVRIFTKAENPKNGSSLALPRREARGLRRVLKRKRVRLNYGKKLFEKYLDIPLEELKEDENIFIKKVKKIDVWQLRSDGLKRALNDEEFARVLTHIAKHRGYKSNRKSYDEKDQNKEKQVILAAIKRNKQLLENYITIGQAIYEESIKDKDIKKKRRNSPQDYSYSISREMLEDEVTIIFQKQRELQNKKANNEFENEYKEIAFKQNSLKSIEKMVGKCTLEKGEKRAPKRSYSAEEFVTLSKLINTKLILPNMDERYFSKDELQKLMELCQDREKPTFKLIRTTINLDDDIKFKGLNYYDEKTGEVVDVEKNEKFKNEFNGFHSLKKITEKTLSKTCWHNISRDKELLNNIATIFSANKDEELIKKELEKLSFPSLTNGEKNILIDALLKDINFSKYNNLSVKAIEKLLPIMYEGKRYDEAVKIVYGEVKNGTKEKFLRDLNDDEKNELTNPVVKRAISQTRKVINAVIRKYGSLDEIHIELSREVKKSFQDRKEIEKKQKENYENKEALIEEFEQNFDKQPTSRELEKFALWKEQGGYCIYSDKKPISIDNLLIDGFCEVDHILPYSRSWDNSRSNKVLCLSIHNQQKKDKIPHKYLAEDVGRSWHQYKEFIESLKSIKGEKRKKLLKESFDENSEKEFQNRNFHDTAFAARFLKNFIESSLIFNNNPKKPVTTINGMLTSNLRYQWRVQDKNRQNHLHHAEDATIIAFTTQSEVQRFATNSAKLYKFSILSKEEKEKTKKLIPPFENFKDALESKLNDVFVSFAPRRKVTGAAHKETVYSPKTFKANKKQEKQDELVGGGLVNNIKTKSGLFKQENMPRVDIFRHKLTKKYYVVPIYVADFIKNKLPNKAIVQGKLADNKTPKLWLEMDNNYEFVFSLFKNELVEIKTKKETVFGYFVGAHSGTGALTIKSHNNTEDDVFKLDENIASKGCGIQNAISLKKYQVGILGDIFEVKNEKRVGTKLEMKKGR